MGKRCGASMSECGGTALCAEGAVIYVSNCSQLRHVDRTIECSLRNGNACYDASSALPYPCTFTLSDKKPPSAPPLVWKCFAPNSDVERSPNEAGLFTQNDIDRCVATPATSGAQ